ncbi:MAG: transaldolase family protein [Candidatus Nanoarchaeia archaeon]
MQIYIDSGNVDEITQSIKTGLISGVTTNPSLIAKEGRDFYEVIQLILHSFYEEHIEEFTVSMEVTHLESIESMVQQGREFSQIDEHIIVKVPLTKNGLKAVSILSNENIKCNVTLCFSASQALLAAKAGAWCVSPFVGRVEDEGWSGIELLKDIKQTFVNYDIETQILAASMRSVNHVHQAMLLGIDMATIPKSIFEKMYYNPLTNIGIEKFESDWREYEKNANE